jgi:hypothetical protein
MSSSTIQIPTVCPAQYFVLFETDTCICTLVPFEQAKLQVPTKAMPWPIDRRQRVSVNSFGVGGTNAHVGLIFG